MDIINEENIKPYIIAISGVKNSGKTTMITKLIPLLKEMGYTTATIKHDGHDFACDVPGTDSFKHRESGADGIAVYSDNKYMIINQSSDNTESMLLSHFQSFDIILLEGFKYSSYPKIELIRNGNSQAQVCDKDTLLAIATDCNNINWDGPFFSINDTQGIAHLIREQIERYRHAR